MEGFVDKTLVAQGVANKLFATEKAIDKAIAEAAQLLGGMAQAREDLRISAVVGDEATRKVAETIATLTEARRAIVEAHGQLDVVKAQIGVRTKLLGVVDKPPPEGALRPTDELRRAG
jgi:hypothetical protein